MWQANAMSMLLGLILLTICAVGVALGHWLEFFQCGAMVSLSTLAGSVLALVALFRPSKPESTRGVQRFAGGILVLYVVLATATEQFAWVGGNYLNVVFGVAWLVPLIIGGVVLPRENCWLTGVACWAVLFGGVTAFSFSVSNSSAGIGLFIGWLS